MVGLAVSHIDDLTTSTDARIRLIVTGRAEFSVLCFKVPLGSVRDGEVL